MDNDLISRLAAKPGSMSDELTQKRMEQAAKEGERQAFEAKAKDETEKDRVSKVDDYIAHHPATPFHRLLDDFFLTLPSQFISRLEGLVGKTKAQVRAEAEAAHPAPKQ